MASQTNQPNPQGGHTKETIIAAIRECMEKMGCIPRVRDLHRAAGVSPHHVTRHFGTYTQALSEAGLEPQGAGYMVALEKLFYDWAGVVRQLGKLPSVAEYRLASKYSARPLTARFGSWKNVPHGLKLYAQTEGLEEEWKDVMELVSRSGKVTVKETSSSTSTSTLPSTLTLQKDRPVFGMSLMPIPMAHAPMNENGVLCLFGMLAEELGFVVLRIQLGFPDCKAMRRIDEKHWQEVWIEFEFESRNFLAHMHDPEGCDLIVCWEHNWPECPLEVVELKGVLGRKPYLGSARMSADKTYHGGTEEAGAER